MMTNEKLVLSIVPADNLTAYNCALEVARRKDEKPINTMWLQANGFNESGFVKIGDSLIRCYATGRNRYFASVDNDERNFHEQFGRIKTIGQFKMFLTLCGVQDFVKQLKA